MLACASGRLLAWSLQTTLFLLAGEELRVDIEIDRPGVPGGDDCPQILSSLGARLGLLDRDLTGDGLLGVLLLLVPDGASAAEGVEASTTACAPCTRAALRDTGPESGGAVQADKILALERDRFRLNQSET